MLLFLMALLVVGTGTLSGMVAFNAITSFLTPPPVVGQNQGLSTWWIDPKDLHFQTESQPTTNPSS